MEKSVEDLMRDLSLAQEKVVQVRTDLSLCVIASWLILAIAPTRSRAKETTTKQQG
jgi:hypothetical protein